MERVINVAVTAASVTEEDTDGLECIGLGWLYSLKSAPLHHTDLAVSAFGAKRYGEIIDWMVEASVYPKWLIEILFDDFLAYKLARASLADRNEALVIAVLPDYAYHLFLINTAENRALDFLLAGELLDHDTAGTAVPLANAGQLRKTIGVFVANRIGYHPELWQDDLRFPRGARLVPSSIEAI